jgi:hypothetical protein
VELLTAYRTDVGEASEFGVLCGPVKRLRWCRRIIEGQIVGRHPIRRRPTILAGVKSFRSIRHRPARRRRATVRPRAHAVGGSPTAIGRLGDTSDTRFPRRLPLANPSSPTSVDRPCPATPNPRQPGFVDCLTISLNPATSKALADSRNGCLPGLFCGADDGIRTRDPHLGEVSWPPTPYQEDFLSCLVKAGFHRTVRRRWAPLLAGQSGTRVAWRRSRTRAGAMTGRRSRTHASRRSVTRSAGDVASGAGDRRSRSAYWRCVSVPVIGYVGAPRAVGASRSGWRRGLRRVRLGPVAGCSGCSTRKSGGGCR